VWDLCGLDEGSSLKKWSLPTTTEIAKCLVNIIFKGDMQSICVKNDLHRRWPRFLEFELIFARLLKVISDPANFPMELAFPILRVLSLVSKPLGDEAVHRILADEGIITVLFSLIRHWFTQVMFDLFQNLTTVLGRLSLYYG
jgi:hypothetical protein